MDNPKELTILSLCTGYGGLELGLSRALANPLRVIAVEIEAYALANLEAKASEGKLAIEAMWPDLKTFPAEKFRGCFDFVIGGYPCQPFSHAGKRQGEDDPRHLWPHIARIIEAVQPLWCFFENVAGHLSLGFPGVYRSLRDMGYSVEAGLFTAAEVGAPHRRQRLFILADAENNGWRDRRNFRELAATSGSEEKTGNQSTQTINHGNQSGQLADTSRQGLQEPRSGRPEPAQPSTISRWPACPGQPQYEWEEPRVVADASIRSGQDESRLRGCPTRDGSGIQGEGNEETEPRLGRAANGPRSRVDRLRLLGNGVVPQQAELAFRTLIGKS